MYLNYEYKMIYIANPKTASVAVKNVLLEHLEFEQYCHRTQQSIMEAFGLSVDVAGGSHHVRLTAPAPDGWTVATGVRNHWKTLLSWWTAHEQFEEPFTWGWIDKWIREHQRQYFPDPNRLFRHGDEFADTILRVEHLQEDLDDWVGGHVPLRRDNGSMKQITVDEAYDEEARQYVAWRFADEIQEYGYEWPGS